MDVVGMVSGAVSQAVVALTPAWTWIATNVTGLIDWLAGLLGM